MLIVWSPDDLFFPREDAYRLEALFAEAEVVERNDCLTYVAEDQPEMLAAAVKRFLGRRGRGSTAVGGSKSRRTA